MRKTAAAQKVSADMAKGRRAVADRLFDKARGSARSQGYRKARRFDTAAGSHGLDADNSDKAASWQMADGLGSDNFDKADCLNSYDSDKADCQDSDNFDKADCLKRTSHYDLGETIAPDWAHGATGFPVTTDLEVRETADPYGWAAPDREYFAALGSG